MRIKTQFITTMLLFGIILVMIAVSAIMTRQQAERAGGQEKIASGIAQGASELSYLANDYLIYREGQQLQRWQSRFGSLSSEVAILNLNKPEQQALVRNIKANQQRLKEVFDSTVSAVGNPFPNQKGVPYPAFLQVSWSRMAVQSQGLVSDASRLSQMLRAEADRLKRINLIVIFAMISVFGAYFLINSFIIQHRTLKSIATLQAGTAIIGSGNLEFKLEEKKNDEIGNLSRAFNRMTTDLKAVTASKTDLEREVKERMRAEAALRQSEQRWATTLASIGDGVIATDVEGRITFLNPVAVALTGWQTEDALGHPVQSVFRIVNEKTRVPAEELVGRVLSEKRMVSLANDTALITKDGRETPIEDSAAPILDADSNITGAVLVFHDVTQRRRAQEALWKSEAKYRTLFDNMAEEVHFWQIVRDETGQIKTWRLVDANPPTLKTWDRIAVDDIRGKTTDEIFGPGAAEHYMPVVRKIMTEGVPYSYEDYFPHLDRYFRFTSVPHGDYFITTGADITTIKKAEESLKKAFEELEIRVQERTSDLSGAIERLRIENIQRKELEDILREKENQIRFFASQCLTAQETERKRIAGELHDSIAASLAATRFRIDKIAEESRQGHFSLESLQDLGSKVTEINHEVRRIMADLRPSILDDLGIIPAMSWFCREYQKTYSHISVNKQVEVSEQEVPDSLKTPIFRISQEAMNNIAKHSQASLVTLFLQMEDEKIELTIQDNGRGFDLETVKKGLGLSTMRERAQLSGGVCSIESVKEAGTTIRCLWPLT